MGGREGRGEKREERECGRVDGRLKMVEAGWYSRRNELTAYELHPSGKERTAAHGPFRVAGTAGDRAVTTVAGSASLEGAAGLPTRN